MRYVVDQEVRLTFPDPVREHQCELRWAPTTNPVQRVTLARIEVEPPADVRAYLDYFGNQVHHFDIVAPHAELVTRMHAEVETLLANPFDYPVVSPGREREWIADTLKSQPRLWDYVLHRSPATPELSRLPPTDLEYPQYDAQRPMLDSLLAASQWVTDTFDYDAAAAPHTTLEAFLADLVGSCHDFAHLLVAVVRAWGIPARYVTGYQDPESLDEPSDTISHAWAEVLIPGAGWRGVDATTRLVVNDSYVIVAVGRDADDTVPQRNSFKGRESDMAPEVTLRLQREAQAQQ